MERVSIFDSSYQQCKRIILLAFYVLITLESYGQTRLPAYSYVGVTELPIRKPSPNELLTYYVNHGHPFASITLSEVIDSTHTQWEVYLGPQVFFDSLAVSQSLIHYKTLCRLTHLMPGDEFSEKKITALRDRIAKIPGVTSCSDIKVHFNENKYTMDLCLNKKKSNRVEALIGINNNASTGKTNLTGNLDLKLENIAHLAETFELNWKRPYPNSQSLNVKFASPFTLGLPLGFAAQFQSFLKDSTFATGNFNFQLLTGATSNEGLVLYIQRNSATAFHSNQSYGNTKAQLYGAKQNFQFNTKSYLFNSLVDLAYGTRLVEDQDASKTKSITKINVSLTCSSNWKSR